uniref:SAP domain-containing protein n=1 Tax=Branchiostoma floridae TaxID=7739 RepID=C3ZZJ9_BRAFL|eukprot:XP_002586018.1 hypothetical protein BRAFLDRAFT_110184 [Branchiostoma floridae]
MLPVLLVGVTTANLVRLAPNTAYVYDYVATSRLGDIAVFVTNAKVLERGHKWMYMVNETGHEGEHSATYSVQPSADGLVFHRTKHGHAVQNAQARHEKEMTYRHDIGMPHDIRVVEMFTAPRKTAEGFNSAEGLPGDPEKHQQLHGDTFDLPMMHANSSSHMTFVGMTPLSGDVILPSNLTNGSLIIVQDEDLEVLNIKKSLVGTLSARLHATDEEMTYKHDIGMPHDIHVVETFTAPQQTAEGFNSAEGLTGDPEKHQQLHGDTFDLPMMHANSSSHMTFVGMTPLSGDATLPSNLTNGSLIIVQPGQPDLPLEGLEKDIVGNLTCVREHQTKGQSTTRSTCFLQLVKLISRLSEDDLGVLSRRFVKVRYQDKTEEETCDIMVDALGSVGTEAAQRLLTLQVLTAEGAPAKLIQRMLISYVSMNTPPIEDFLRSLEEICFKRKVEYQDPRDEWMVHNTALLILGAVADRLKHTDPERARGLVRKLENSVGVHDPWHHRQLREALTRDELKRHYHEKATILQALGNAEFDSSFDHLVSYVNNTDSPPLLRTTALSAIRKYGHAEAAGLLLDSALFDEEEHVRYHAALQYQRHPKALNLRQMKQDLANGLVNVSHYLDDVISLTKAMSQNPHLRKRRGVVEDVLDSLIQGIQFELKLPGVEWHRKIGSDKIGAEFGLIMKNTFDLDIRLSEGRADLDIYDHAYARGLLGAFDMKFDFIDTGICFIGGISYKVNILQDFNFKKLLDLIKTWFRDVPAVIKDVKGTIETFRNLFSHLENTSPEEIFKSLLDAIQTFPDRITAISRWARDTLERIGAYDNLPSFIAEARQVLLRVATLFNDVKKSITELVNTIADSIHVVLPWGAEQIWQGLQTIFQEIRNLIRSPQTAAGNIAKAVYRFALARSIIHKIFGPKASFRFPRRIFDSETCGQGVYPSFGVGGKTYESEGIDLEIRQGRKIHKGEKVGTAAATGCEKNSIHFAIKALGSDEYVDPTRYLRKPVMTSGDNKPGWRQHCDMYWLMFMGETIASGNLTDILKDEDETPEEPDVDLDDSARSSTAITSLSSETYTKRSLKREIAVALTNNPDFAQTIGVHNVTDITNTFSIRLQDLKLSKVLDILQLLDEPDMGAIRDRLLSTTEQVQVRYVLMLTGKQPYWFHLKTQIEEILDDIQRVWQLFKEEAPAWVDGFVDHSTDVLGQAFSHETLSELRRKVIDEFKAALEDLPNQIGPTADIIQPFLDAYKSTVGTVKKVKSCYDSLKQGFALARSIIHKIFGPKASLRFPRRIFDSEICGRGVYPSFGVGGKTYESEGIDLDIRQGRKVVAPFAGEVTTISAEKIVIVTEDIKDMEVIIEGVNVATSIEQGQRIHKGEKVGTAAATGCEKNSIHFAIKAVGSDEYVDPTRYLRKPVMTSGDNKPGWRQHCDMYWLMFMGKTIESGNLTDILKDEDETPEEPDVDLDDSARRSMAITSLSSEIYTRRSLKREIAVALTNDPDFAQTIGVHNVTDITKSFSIRLQDLKLSKVLDILQLLDEPDMGAIRDRLLSTTEQVQKYLDADPFKLPGTLTDDQLRRELQRRGKSAKGSRQQLLQRYTTTKDNGCPNIFHHLNKLTNIYCDIQDDCLGFKCSLSFPTSPHTEVTTKAGVRFDPCTMKLTMELGRHREEKNLTSAGFVPVTDLTLAQFETELHYISRSEMGRVLPEANLTDMNRLVRDLTRVLRMSYKEVLVASIDLAVQEAVQELESSDSYLNGSFPLGPWDKTFFEGKATPDVSAVVEASVGVSLLLISGELQLKGYILKTAFPSAAEITFDKFPLNVGVRMDMVMVPLRLELHGIVKIFSKKIIDIMIWHYETSPVSKNIFNTGLPEPDLTPPKFRKFKLERRKAKSRRSEVTSHCDVQQLPGRDVMEPAFQLAVAAEDDVSQVKLTYDVGTYRGGSDVVKGEDLGGPSNIIVRSMKGGVPLYFTVTAENSGGGDAKVTCELSTYDVTLPGGRVTPDFLTTSHPSILRASAVAFDDSEIIQKLAAVGYGRKVYGDQVVTWHDVNTTTNTITTGHPPTALERFTGSRLGKVISAPVETSRVDIPEQCAAECLKLPPSKCLSFNYDYGHNDCELLEEIEGHGVEMHEVCHFHNFERLGVGHAVEFRHENLQLHHNELHYFNFFLNNTLGYSNTLTSPGVLADFTPPSPGPLENVIMDVLMTEDCGDFVLDHWELARCVEQTPLQNHRWIVDGEGSRTVFNGHEPLVDMRYTRANRYVSANWDGFHDNETGIHGYSWTVGTTPCQEDVHPHIDPHAHLFDVSEWTHEGIASPLFLEDGKYHVTVRAINSVEFGGAMAATVCHTTPYVIDNTPPFVHHVHSVRYDDDVISAEYNVSDPLSDIREIDFGLGRSKRDVHMMDWYRHGNTTHTSVNFHIPDGVPAWVKVRAINNVDLREVGHAEYPLLVDTTPPVAGTLYDGGVHGHDLNFTSDPNTICANWKDFHDEHSGLILFDATPPVEGTLRDGLEPDSDLAFSSEPSTVSANWDGYSDPESGIGDYAVTVKRTSSVDGANFEYN